MWEFWGDFDVDGQTATALLVACLRDLGAQVVYHIPLRETEGHGVTLPALQQFIDRGVTLVLTCDTGIAAHEAVAYAASRAVDFVITDHHDLATTLPDAVAVVNPKRLTPDHAAATLPGVGVAYKLAEALFQATGRTWQPGDHIDLAALGIIADVATLRGDTRALAQVGIAALRQPRRLGLQVMMARAGLTPAWLTEGDIGFQIAPRLNALGRLDDANVAVEFLTTDDPVRANVIATQLEGLNGRRRMLTGQVLQGALAQVDRDPALLDSPVLVLAHPQWPAGIIGIVASQLVERFGRPVILFQAPPDQPARGSARSIDGIDISAAIGALSDMLISFGGHPMAAGLAVDPARLPEFRRRLAQEVGSLPGAGETPPLQIDADLPLSELTPALVSDLERLAPFGAGNPAPLLLARNLTLVGDRKIGRAGDHRIVTVSDADGGDYPVVWWGGAGESLPDGMFDLVYGASFNVFRGDRSVQI